MSLLQNIFALSKAKIFSTTSGGHKNTVKEDKEVAPNFANALAHWLDSR